MTFFSDYVHVFFLSSNVGFAYALVWSTSVAEVDSYFQVEQKSIAQGILAALFSGLGYGIGCLTGGYVLNVYGSVRLFQLSALICGISLSVFLFGRQTTPTTRRM